MIKIEFNDVAEMEVSCNLNISESAVKKLEQVFAENPGKFLRLKVLSGGCNGFSYSFDLDDTKTDNDFTIEESGVSVVIDKSSAEYVNDSTLDFVEELQASHFKVINPNATSSCSCGTSFSI